MLGVENPPVQPGETPEPYTPGRYIFKFAGMVVPRPWPRLVWLPSDRTLHTGDASDVTTKLFSVPRTYRPCGAPARAPTEGPWRRWHAAGVVETANSVGVNLARCASAEKVLNILNAASR